MTAFPSYSTGTVAVANGATAIVGVGSIWSGVNARPGDDIVIAGQTVVVQDVTDTTHLVIDPWPFATVAAGATYKIVQRSPLRYAGGQAMADVSTLVAALNTDGFYVFVSPILAVPDPSYGNDQQYAYQPSTGKLWLKTGGAWVLQGIFKGFNITGAWNSATAYKVNDVVNLNGTSYVCILAHTNFTPPNATYWTVLASIGATGPAPWSPPAAWLTATAYVAGPPASVVTQAGETYVCLVSHTSGTFATDLAAAKWIKVTNSASFIQAGTGAVTRTMQDKARDFVSVKDFGATGDGTTVDYTAIVAADAAAAAAGRALYFPAGTYNIAGNTYTPSQSMRIVGENRATTVIRSTSATA